MSNNDLISREYLRDAFDNLCCHNCKTCRNFRKEGCSFYRCDLIDNAPIVERPQGEWIIVKDEKWGDNVKCPFCEKELAGTDLNFCCKCGADMRGEEE